MENQRPITSEKIEMIDGSPSRDFSFFENEIDRGECAAWFSMQRFPLLAWLPKPTTILDVGANVGAASVFFALNYPDATIHAYEPNPECWNLLELNTVGLNVEIHRYGLAYCKQAATLRTGPASALASCVSKSAGTLNLGTHQTTLQSVYEEIPDHAKGGWWLSLDVEGMERGIIQGVMELPEWKSPDVIFVEFHSEKFRRELEQTLNEYWLCFGRITGPHRGELLYVRNECVPDDVLADEITE